MSRNLLDLCPGVEWRAGSSGFKLAFRKKKRNKTPTRPDLLPSLAYADLYKGTCLRPCYVSSINLPSAGPNPPLSSTALLLASLPSYILLRPAELFLSAKAPSPCVWQRGLTWWFGVWVGRPARDCPSQLIMQDL